jgi:hypothetical protein
MFIFSSNSAHRYHPPFLGFITRYRVSCVETQSDRQNLARRFALLMAASEFSITRCLLSSLRGALSVTSLQYARRPLDPAGPRGGKTAQLCFAPILVSESEDGLQRGEEEKPPAPAQIC